MASLSVQSNVACLSLKFEFSRFVIFRLDLIKDKLVIQLEASGVRGATYSDFLLKLQEYKNECRYCVFDFPGNSEIIRDGVVVTIPTNYRIIIFWCPSGADVLMKMLYSKSTEALKKALVGVYKYIQVCDYTMASEEVLSLILKVPSKPADVRPENREFDSDGMSMNNQDS